MRRSVSKIISVFISEMRLKTSAYLSWSTWLEVCFNQILRQVDWGFKTMLKIQMPGERFWAPSGITSHDLTTDLEWILVVCTLFGWDFCLELMFLDSVDNLGDEVGPDPQDLPAVELLVFLGWRCRSLEAASGRRERWERER